MRRERINGYTGKIIPGVGYVKVPNPPKEEMVKWPFHVLLWIVVLLAVLKFF